MANDAGTPTAKSQETGTEKAQRIARQKALQLAQAKDDPLPLIIPARGISFLAGAPGVGKTALLATLLRDLRDGRPIFGHQPGRLNGLAIISADRGWVGGPGPWFDRVGFGDIARYVMADDPTFDPRSLRRKFERTLKLAEFIDKLKMPAGSLVAVDPIGMFLGGNLIDYDACAVSCHELRALLRDRDLALLGLAHTSKMKADKRERYLRPQDQILGSAALFGFGDTQMVLCSPEEIGRPHYSFLWHPHLTPAELFNLERDEHGLFVPYTGVDRTAITCILAFFPETDAEITFGALQELVETIPYTKRTLQRVLGQLIEEGKIVKVRHGVYRRVLLH